MATSVREDGRRPRTNRDGQRAQAECRKIEAELGLRRLKSGDFTAAPTPTSAEQAKAQRAGSTPRRRRSGCATQAYAAAAAARDEAEYFSDAQRPRHQDQVPAGPADRRRHRLQPRRTRRHQQPRANPSTSAAPPSPPTCPSTACANASPPTTPPTSPPPHQRTGTPGSRPTPPCATSTPASSTRTPGGRGRPGSGQRDPGPGSGLQRTAPQRRRHRTRPRRAELRAAALGVQPRQPLRDPRRAPERRSPAHRQPRNCSTPLRLRQNGGAVAALLSTAVSRAHRPGPLARDPRATSSRPPQPTRPSSTCRPPTGRPPRPSWPTSPHARSPARRPPSASATVLRATVPDHADRILADPAWPALATTLAQAESAGQNPPTRPRRDRRGQRELDTADHPAEVLNWRLRNATADQVDARVHTASARTHRPAATASPASASALLQQPNSAARRGR